MDWSLCSRAGSSPGARPVLVWAAGWGAGLEWRVVSAGGGILGGVEWTVHGERRIYSNPYVSLCLVDVEQPDGRRWEYHVVRLRSLAAVVLLDAQERVLLMWRHRFITG